MGLYFDKKIYIEGEFTGNYYQLEIFPQFMD
jgi:hypothetical protein